MGKLSLQKPAFSVQSLLSVSLLASLTLAFFLLTPVKSHAVDKTTPVVTNTAPATASNSTWNSLTAQQKQALAPIVNDWPKLSPDHKQKWLVFANKYPQLKPEEQQRAQEKMQAWAKLTPEQRLAARQNYLRSNKLQPDERNQKWQEYQQLPDEQKAQLASHPAKKTLLTTLPTPAESKEKKLQPLKIPHKSVISNPTVSPAAIAPAASGTASTTPVATPAAPPATGTSQQ